MVTGLADRAGLYALQLYCCSNVCYAASFNASSKILCEASPPVAGEEAGGGQWTSRVEVSEVPGEDGRSVCVSVCVSVCNFLLSSNSKSATKRDLDIKLQRK